MCLWQKDFLEPEATACLQVKHLPPLHSQSKKAGGKVCKRNSRQPVNLIGCGTYIPKKASSSWDKQAKRRFGWESRQRSISEQKKGQHRTEQTGSSNMKAGAICQHSSAHTQSVRKGLSVVLLLACSLWFLSVFLLATSRIPCTTHPPNFNINTHTHTPLHLRCREACWLEEEGQEDEMAWEGLSPKGSICFLVCPPGWLLAPAQLLHSLQPDANHKHIYTQLDSTQLNHSADRLDHFCFSFFFLIITKKERFSAWLSNEISVLWAKGLHNTLKWTPENMLSILLHSCRQNYEEKHQIFHLEILLKG